MAKYHISPEHGPMPCRAQKQCKFGDVEHFDSKEKAHAYFEKTMSAFPPKPSLEDYERVRTDAKYLARYMDGEPEHLPAVEDINAKDVWDEEDAYIKTMEAFQHPRQAANNCIAVAEAFQLYTEGEYGVIEQEIGNFYLNLHAANTYVDSKGQKWVVDYTYSQVDPTAEWPHVATEEEWRVAVKNAGREHLDILVEQYENRVDSSYKMTQQPDEDGALGFAIESHFPNFYEHPEYYADHSQESRESVRVLKQIRNRPEAEVIIYRALPDAAMGIHPGNWITLSETYAKTHALQHDGTQWPVISMRVKAKDIRTPGDSIHEFGYYPESD